MINTNLTTIDNNPVQTVNARDLHGNLEVKREFAKWIRDQIQRAGLEEGVDYGVFAQKDENSVSCGLEEKCSLTNNLGGRPTIDYFLTIESAKHVAMMSNTPKGKEVRNYFIRLEREVHSIQSAQAQVKALEMVKTTPQYQLGQTLFKSLNVATLREIQMPRPGGKHKMTKALREFLQTPSAHLDLNTLNTVVSVLSRT